MSSPRNSHHRDEVQYNIDPDLREKLSLKFYRESRNNLDNVVKQPKRLSTK